MYVADIMFLMPACIVDLAEQQSNVFSLVMPVAFLPSLLLHALKKRKKQTLKLPSSHSFISMTHHHQPIPQSPSSHNHHRCINVWLLNSPQTVGTQSCRTHTLPLQLPTRPHAVLGRRERNPHQTLLAHNLPLPATFPHQFPTRGVLPHPHRDSGSGVVCAVVSCRVLALR